MKSIRNILCYFIFAGLVYSQSNSGEVNNAENTSLSDSVRVNHSEMSINELKQILFAPKIYNPYTDYLAKQKDLFSNPYSMESEYNSASLHLNNSLESFDIGKKNLMYAISLQPKFLNADELGMFGEVLIYANFAALGYALYQHLHKYKDEY